jgi:cyclic pyranopterin phosphate synthase
MSDLSHLNERGEARMVDVTAKDVTTREATARCRVSVSAEVARLLATGQMPKGDALAVARIAAIQATKRTPDLIPLCHPIAVHGVDVEVSLTDDGSAVEVLATVRTADRTGVEMEALTRWCCWTRRVAGQGTGCVARDLHCPRHHLLDSRGSRPVGRHLGPDHRRGPA